MGAGLSYKDTEQFTQRLDWQAGIVRMRIISGA